MQSAAAFHSMTVAMAKSSNKKDFQWTDDEAEILLHSTHLFKVKKEMECEDWEAAKVKVSREPTKPYREQANASVSKIVSRQRGEAF